jgi:hypothetical protein
VKQIWEGRALQAASRFGEVAQSSTVCCNACRTCVTTNLAGLALGALAAAGISIGRFARRFVQLS